MTNFVLFSNLSTLSAPEEGCSRNGSSALHLISSFLLVHVHDMNHSLRFTITLVK